MRSTHRHEDVLRIVLVNLMPEMPVAEAQFARLLDSSLVDVELVLTLPPGRVPRHTDPRHIATFYRPWREIESGAFDGLIVTGAPVETLSFAAVDYWPWFRGMSDWAGQRVGHSLFVCWAAQAALYHRYGIAKRPLERKAFGVFRHHLHDSCHPLMRGLPHAFPVPVSRHSTVAAADVSGHGGLDILVSSEQSGLCLIADRAQPSVYMFNHLEYDARSLHDEYVRDLAAGRPTPWPHDYYRGDGLAPPRVARWRPVGIDLVGNWLDMIAAQRGLATRRSAA